MLRSARVAREAGASTIAVTRSGTPLAAAVDLCIAADVPEDTFVYAPMTTRLAQLAVVDILATGVARRSRRISSGEGIDEGPVAGRRGRACRRETSPAAREGSETMI